MSGVPQGFYNLDTFQWQSIADTAFVAAARVSQQPGQTPTLPPRLARHFAQVALAQPSQAAVHAMVATFAVGCFQSFAEGVRDAVGPLVKASVAAFEQLGRVLAPVGPETSHYAFSLHDVLRHVQVCAREIVRGR